MMIGRSLGITIIHVTPRRSDSRSYNQFSSSSSSSIPPSQHSKTNSQFPRSLQTKLKPFHIFMKNTIFCPPVVKITDSNIIFNQSAAHIHVNSGAATETEVQPLKPKRSVYTSTFHITIIIYYYLLLLLFTLFLFLHC